MKLDRLSFLALATSIAAAACSSAPADDGADEGAVESAGSCLSPGNDAPISDRALDSCAALAQRGEAVGEHGPSLKSVCGGYLTNFKAGAAVEAQKCLDAIRPSAGGRGMLLDWEAVYGCGFDTLASSCPSREAERECDALLPQLKTGQRTTREGKDDAASLREECVGFMSGLKPSARTTVKQCVLAQSDYPLPLYSCVEGIDPNGRAVCMDGKARPRTPEGAALTRQENAFQCLYLPGPEAEGLCLQFTAATRVRVGAEIAQRMRMVPAGMNKYLDQLYAAALATLRGTCGDPAVNDICKEVVAKYTAAGVSNKGGRITRECRSLFPGLLKEARTRVLSSAVPTDGKIVTALVKLPVVQPTELPGEETELE